MIPGILFFSIAAFVGSYLITKKHAELERSELALYIVLIAWCSLIVGMYLSRLGAGHVAQVALR